uniref:Uncharacterized protein n=1 Tax=Spongospora subterranea TaxID=70186 RepID=A0A0H5QIH9_9EUKA|eukprot:CRZ01874.1 hypothetical protein [Spongospora subterranea]
MSGYRHLIRLLQPHIALVQADERIGDLERELLRPEQAVILTLQRVQVNLNPNRMAAGISLFNHTDTTFSSMPLKSNAHTIIRISSFLNDPSNCLNAFSRFVTTSSFDWFPGNSFSMRSPFSNQRTGHYLFYYPFSSS